MMKMRNLIAALLVMALALTLCACDSGDYKKATGLYEAGSYEEAAAMFEALGDYEDSAKMAKKCYYEQACGLMEAGEYEAAEAIFAELDGFDDSDEKLLECRYAHASALFAAADYEAAKAIFAGLGSYQDSAALAADCDKQMMLAAYGDLIQALNGNTWFYADTSVNAVNWIAFSDDLTAVTGSIYYDGNGKHIIEQEYTGTYVVDDANVTVTLNDGSVLTIPYTLNGGEVKLGSGDYLSPAEVDAALQGYWKERGCTYNTFTGFVWHEYNILIDNGTITYENATPVYGDRTGAYYYYGPYEGTYSITADGFVTDVKNGHQFGFVFSEGQLVMLRYDHVSKPGTGFPGQEGYSF